MGSRLEHKSTLVRKRIESHTFSNESGEEYEGSAFGGFTDYFRRKKIKLQNLDASIRAEAASKNKPQIFKGVVCHVNGYTQPSLNDLHVLIVQHGGGFMQYLDGKTMVTHIVAANLTPKKKEEFKRYRIVKPAWIVDSVKAGKLLPWDAYRVIEEGAGQRVLGFEGGNVVSQVGKQAVGYREQTERSWYTSQLKGSQVPGASRRVPGSAAQTQTITPTEDVEDDEFPGLTSSMEEAMGNVLPEDFEDEDGDLEQRVYGEQSPTKSTLQTPPPSSPQVAPRKSRATAIDEIDEVQLDEVDAPEEPAKLHTRALPSSPRKATPKRNAVEEPYQITTEAPAAASLLRDREGSQEPDYSMAVVRDSEVLKAVSAEDLAKMTAEEHNALLLSDPRIRKSTVVHPNFLDQYYRESRLHHLSTWKADLKSQLQALAAEKTLTQRSTVKKLPGQRRYIMHVDFDSFFAAVSLKKHPQYKDKPAVVAHGGGSGSEIASCNYPAREFGIKNGMWMKRAQDLCPQVKILPYDFPGYEEASRKFYDAILTSGGVVQSVSIDEALVDISAMCIAEGGTDGVKRSEGCQYREQKKADEIAQGIRDQVFEKTGCAVSVGIGANILQAKIALRKAKPAGQYHLKSEDVLEFIGQLEVQSLPGIAWSIGGKLEEIGIKLVKDIRECSREKLINTLGPKTGEKVWDYARGIDKTEVGDQVIRKSVSAEVNWGVRFENQEQVDEFMHGLSGELHKRLVNERVRGKQLTMKVMRRAADAPLDPPKHLGHGKCDTYNKSLQLGVATNDANAIAKDVIAMMKSFNISPGELRGIGIQMQKLEPLKVTGEGQAESSQRRLHFKSDPAMATSKAITVDQPGAKVVEDEIRDDVHTPEKPRRFRDVNQPSVSIQPATARTPTRKSLNITGTQFVLPTQVDPKVLAELPADIRARLAKHIRPSIEAVASDVPTRPDNARPSRAVSRAQSPAVMLPNMSQLDPTILAELPEAVRAELLGQYRSPRKAREQALLPQSPRKSRILPPPPKPIVRRKRGGGLFAGKSRAPAGDNSTLTQSNFVSRPQAQQLPTTTEAPTSEDLDPDFLAALPEDIRLEVLAQQRQSRLQRTGGIDTSLHQRRKPANGKQKPAEPAIRTLQLPPHLPKPTFTPHKLSSLSDLRDAVKAWYLEFTDEGPYGEDVEALVVYLRNVVVGEKDLDKAVRVVKWMGWVVGDREEEGREAWEDAVERVKQSVREVARERGMGEVDLD